MFFFNDTATTEIYTLSLHDALPISIGRRSAPAGAEPRRPVHRNKVISADAAAQIVLDGDTVATGGFVGVGLDRKSTRLNSSHANISYAVFCLKKKTPYNTCAVLHHS